MGKWASRLVFAFLIILATLGMAAYVMQNALQELTAAGKTDSLYYRNLKQMVEECEDLKITLENEGWDFNY